MDWIRDSGSEIQDLEKRIEDPGSGSTVKKHRISDPSSGSATLPTSMEWCHIRHTVPVLTPSETQLPLNRLSV
jgi:hypothetical protein